MPQKATHLTYVGLGLDSADIGVPTYGGQIARYTANGVLKIGDVVYVSAANTVSKSNTQANYATFAGVVVGSLVDFDGAVVGDDSNLVGSSLTSGAEVLVQISGIAKVVADAAITVGTRISQGATTAGRVDDTAFTAGQMCGIALGAATLAGDILAMQIQPK